MTIKQGGKDFVCLIIGWVPSGFSRFLARNHTYKLDKLLAAIGCSRYSIAWLLGEEKRNRGLSPALTATQMEHTKCGFVPALLQYEQMLFDRTAPCRTVDATHRNCSGVWCDHRRLLYRRFFKFYKSFCILNFHVLQWNGSPLSSPQNKLGYLLVPG